MAQAREVCRREGGEICLAPPLALPSAGRRHQRKADPRGSSRDDTPSPRSRRCRHRRLPRRPHWGILPQAPPFAWTWLDAPLTIGGRDSSSSSSSLSFPSPSLRTSTSLRTDTACHGRPRPPSLEASRTEHRSVPTKAKDSLKKGIEGNLESKPYEKKELTRSIEPTSGLMGKPLTCSGWKSPVAAALTRATTSSSVGASLDIRHASRSRDEMPGPISSILSGRDISGRTL